MPMCTGVANLSHRPVLLRTGAGSLTLRRALMCTGVGNLVLRLVVMVVGVGNQSLRPELPCTGGGGIQHSPSPNPPIRAVDGAEPVSMARLRERGTWRGQPEGGAGRGRGEGEKASLTPLCTVCAQRIALGASLKGPPVNKYLARPCLPCPAMCLIGR